MEDAKFTNLIGKYLSGNMSPPEKKELMSWAESDTTNQSYLEDMIDVWGKDGRCGASVRSRRRGCLGESRSKTAFCRVRAAYWRKGSFHKKGVVVVGCRSLQLRWWFLAVGWWWSTSTGQTDAWVAVNTLDDEVKEFTLPDGSQIWLECQF